jgi:hypothetical protein
MTRPDRYGSGEIFGTEENFQAYRIDKLLEAKADKLQKEKRLILIGYGNFRDHHEKTQAQMNELKIRNDYRDGPARKHDWHSGWVEEAAKLLLETKDGKE